MGFTDQAKATQRDFPHVIYDGLIGNATQVHVAAHESKLY